MNALKQKWYDEIQERAYQTMLSSTAVELKPTIYLHYQREPTEEKVPSSMGVGNVFWALNCLRGHASGLQYEWAENTLANIKVYMAVLQKGMRMAQL